MSRRSSVSITRNSALAAHGWGDAATTSAARTCASAPARATRRANGGLRLGDRAGVRAGERRMPRLPRTRVMRRSRGGVGISSGCGLGDLLLSGEPPYGLLEAGLRDHAELPVHGRFTERLVAQDVQNIGRARHFLGYLVLGGSLHCCHEWNEPVDPQPLYEGFVPERHPQVFDRVLGECISAEEVHRTFGQCIREVAVAFKLLELDQFAHTVLVGELVECLKPHCGVGLHRGPGSVLHRYLLDPRLGKLLKLSPPYQSVDVARTEQCCKPSGVRAREQLWCHAQRLGQQTAFHIILAELLVSEQCLDGGVFKNLPHVVLRANLPKLV